MEKTILRQLAELQEIPFAALKERWKSLFGTQPPTYKRDHMIRRLAYRIQELAYGGLPDETNAELERIVEDDSGKPRRKSKKAQLTVGTRIVRDWKGRRLEVTAVDGGFDYQGMRYKSLSAIAKVVTGAHWNGRQFFGLRMGNKVKEAS